MNHCYYWKEFSQGDKLPKDALRLGNYFRDGPLYVGRRAAHDENGKVNTTEGHTKLNHLRSPNLDKTTFGEVLCGIPESVYWKHFVKNNPIPKDAIRGGSFWSDCGELYIGKNSQGEIGKINSCGGKLKLMYCHDCGSTDNGYILCEKPLQVDRFDYYFVSIVEIEGGKEGDIQIKHSVEYGFKGAKFDTKIIRNISAQASSNFSAVAPRNMTPWLKKEMEAIEEVYDEMRTSEVTLNVNLAKPFYLYQVEVTATVNYGMVIVLKRRALVQYDSPVVEKHFKNLHPIWKTSLLLSVSQNVNCIFNTTFMKVFLESTWTLRVLINPSLY